VAVKMAATLKQSADQVGFKANYTPILQRHAVFAGTGPFCRDMRYLQVQAHFAGTFGFAGPLGFAPQLEASSARGQHDSSQPRHGLILRASSDLQARCGSSPAHLEGQLGFASQVRFKPSSS
jgi:hypothetical protein